MAIRLPGPDRPRMPRLPQSGLQKKALRMRREQIGLRNYRGNPWRWGAPGNTLRNPPGRRPATPGSGAGAGAGGATGGTSAPPTPVDPYKDYPVWARRTLRQMDADQKAAEEHGRAVQQWLTGALAPVQAAHQASVNNYEQSMANIPSLRIANPAVQGMGGGSVQQGSPNQYVLDATNMASKGYGEVAQGQGAINTFLRNAGMGNLRQSLEANLAGQVLQVPNQYKKEKNAYLSKLDEFLAGQEAAQAQFDAELARETTNDWYDFIATMGNQGVKLTDIQTDSRDKAKDRIITAGKGSGGVVVNSPTRPTTPGYTWYQEGKGKWRGIKIPTSGSGKGKPTGLIGPVSSGAKPPKGYRIVTSGGKTYFLKVGGTGSGNSSGGITPAEMRQHRNDALDLWRGKPLSNPTTGEVTYAAGLNKAAVGNLVDPTTGQARAGRTAGIPNSELVTHVRIQRLFDQIVAAANAETGFRIVEGIVGRGPFARWQNFVTKKNGEKLMKRLRLI